MESLPMHGVIDDKLGNALALAVARHPRANLQQLAALAGISKATLYRIAPTREAVVALLATRASSHMRGALEKARLDEAPFAAALQRLTAGVMQGKEWYLFWSASLWSDLHDAKNDEVTGYTPSFYSAALEAYFLNGQKAGVFRVDMSAKWLAKAYDFLLYAAAESAQKGEIATVGIPAMVDQLFLSGASTANVTHMG